MRESRFQGATRPYRTTQLSARVRISVWLPISPRRRERCDVLWHVTEIAASDGDVNRHSRGVRVLLIGVTWISSLSSSLMPLLIWICL